MDKDKISTGEVERRHFPLPGGGIELRAGDDGEARGIEGLGIPVEVTADIGPFTESISRSAVQDAVSQGWDIRGLYNHDPNMLLGKTGSGTMTVKSTREGLRYEIPELPASRADVLEAVKRGDLDGNSFSFTVASEQWDEADDEREKPHRTIKRFGKLFDTGPVVFPAYDGATVVSARAMDHVKSLEDERAASEQAAAEAAQAEEAAKASEAAAADMALKRKQVVLAKAKLSANV